MAVEAPGEILERRACMTWHGFDNHNRVVGPGARAGPVAIKDDELLAVVHWITRGAQ